MRRQVETILKALLAASLAASLLGCAASRPPQRIQDAIHTANRYMPEYVAEANKALADAEHPDRERLVGIGDRLAVVLDALDRWAAGQEKTPSAGWRTRSSGDRDTCATATGDNGSTGRTKPRTFSARTRTSST